MEHRADLANSICPKPSSKKDTLSFNLTYRANRGIGFILVCFVAVVTRQHIPKPFLKVFMICVLILDPHPLLCAESLLQLVLSHPGHGKLRSLEWKATGCFISHLKSFTSSKNKWWRVPDFSLERLVDPLTDHKVWKGCGSLSAETGWNHYQGEWVLSRLGRDLEIGL